MRNYVFSKIFYENITCVLCNYLYEKMKFINSRYSKNTHNTITQPSFFQHCTTKFNTPLSFHK
jgi:hypothetical protein